MNGKQAMVISIALCVAAARAAEPDAGKRIAYMRDHFGEMAFGPEGGFILREGQRLPMLVWHEPEVASALLEDTAIRTRWFDSAFNEVDTAEGTGTYYVYGEAPVPKGHPLCRAMTCWCLGNGTDLDSLALKLYPGADSQEVIERWREDEESTIDLVGKLAAGPPFEDERPGLWHMANATVHVRLKRMIRGLDSPPASVLPRRLGSDPAPVLTMGAAPSSDADREFRQAMLALLAEWASDSPAPMSVVAARRGNVVVSQGHGTISGKPVTVNTPMLLHSAMKPIMGLQLAMYVDRGLVDLDQPIGDFLPEFDTPRDRNLTFRAAQVHVTGVHFPWALAFSRHFYFHTWHEALIAQCPREWPPGEGYRYGCVGMSLSVRAVELLAGRNYWEAMEEELLGPLGIRDMWPGGTGFSAEDLARLGVLVANGGRYGDLEFFSGETCRAMMPVQLRTHFTKLDKAISRGIGFVVISPGYYGHGGGCGTLLMVEPEKHIVFAMTRMEADDDLKVFKRKAYALLQTYRKAAPPCRP